MAHFNDVAKELGWIESQLKEAGNALWALNSAVKSASCSPEDFLPRRLSSLKEETQGKVDALVARLHDVLNRHFGRKLIAFHSAADVEAINDIRRTVRYLANAFASELPVQETLSQLNSVLPFQKRQAR